MKYICDLCIWLVLCHLVWSKVVHVLDMRDRTAELALFIYGFWLPPVAHPLLPPYCAVVCIKCRVLLWGLPRGKDLPKPTSPCHMTHINQSQQNLQSTKEVTKWITKDSHLQVQNTFHEDLTI